MKLFNYRQNNSGGDFVIDKQVTTNVLIEANDYDEANSLAEQHGIYFHGCELGYDCDCCGDRWSTAWDDIVDDYSVFEFTDKEAALAYFRSKDSNPYIHDAYIYFKDESKVVIDL